MSRIYLAVGRNNGNILNDYTVFLLQRLTKTGDVYYLNNGTMPASELQKLQDCIVYADSVVHNGNDYGSWQYLIYHLGWQKLLEYDEVVFCNENTYAPLNHLQNISAYLKFQNYDFWGMTEKYNHIPEDNGRFIIFKHDIIKNSKFQEFWDNIIFRDKRDTYKTILSPFLKELGFNGKTDFKNYKQITPVNLRKSSIRIKSPISYGSTFAPKPEQPQQKSLSNLIKNLKNGINIFHSGF